MFNLFRKKQDPITAINEAASKLVLVSISYTDSKGALSERLVEPYEIKNGSLYAYCIDKNSIRMFKTSNITSANITNTKFSPRWPINI